MTCLPSINRIDGTFLRWSTAFRSYLLSEYPLPEGLTPIPEDVVLPPIYLLRFHSKMGCDLSQESPSVPATEPQQGSLNPNSKSESGRVSAIGEMADEDIPPAPQFYNDEKAAAFSYLTIASPISEEELKDSRDQATAVDVRHHDCDKPLGGLPPEQLDKLNILKDSHSQYGIVGPLPVLTNQPPGTLLPIPDSWEVTLVRNDRVTPQKHWQDVRQVRLSVPPSAVSGETLDCKPGDCVTLYPKNFPDDVQKLIDMMDWGDVADKQLGLSAAGELPRGLFAINNCTLRDLLTHNLDITAIPRRSFLKSMAFFTTDEYHKQRLLEFTMPEYTDEFYDYTTRPRRTILEVLDEFTSVKLPADRVLDIFPIMRGRDFSIANGGVCLSHGDDNPENVHVELLIALVKYKTILRKARKGLLSRYLENLPVGTRLRMVHKPTMATLHGPEQAKRPLVAIATGTGIAPTRALIWERLQHRGAGPTVLFFGNRNRAADYFFEEEWATLAQATAEPPDALLQSIEGVFTMYTAFSRDQPEKLYVQDLLRRESDLLSDLIKRDAIFCICGGSSRMAEACKQAILDGLVSEHAATDEEDAKRIFAQLTWWQEIW
jgi:NAD(P)H-flavin reductase